MSRRTIFLILAALAAAAFVRLGLWQLDRHEQRLSRNASILARLDQPTLRLPEHGPIRPEDSYRRAQATGRFDTAHQVLLMNRPYQDQPGYHLVTPLLLAEDSPAMLVDRGWIPQEADTPERLADFAIEGPVSVTGRLLPSQPEPSWSVLADPTPAPGERRMSWRALNIPTIQLQVPYPLAALYLEQDSPLDRSPGSPIPAPELELSAGPHLGYAIQWFAFAAIAVSGAIVWARRQSAQR